MLIVSLSLHEAARVTPQNEFTTLVIHEDGQAEGDRREPPRDSETQIQQKTLYT